MAMIMINDIQALISSKLTDIERQVRELQQSCVLYGIKDGKIAHRLQHVSEALADAQTRALTGRSGA